MALTVLRKAPLIPIQIKNFHHEWILELVKGFISINGYDHVIFIIWCIMLIDVYMLKHPWVAGMNPT